jgi:transposase-like protein
MGDAMASVDNNETAGSENATAADDSTTERRPYIVVLMSEDMKAAVKAFAESHNTNPTALARKLLAEHVGYDLSSEPETGTRKKYETQEEKDAAHKLASKKSGLLRKALFQVHNAQIKMAKNANNANAKLLLAAANATVLAMSDPQDMQSLESLDATLNAAIKTAR